MKDCRDCKHVTTPKGKSCCTMMRILTEKVCEKRLPFYPGVVIPILDEIADSCKRYKHA